MACPMSGSMSWTRLSSPSCCNFLSRWLARDRGRLGASLEEFVGHPAYNTGELRQDLDRFTFLLGGDDGESLFGHGTAE